MPTRTPPPQATPERNRLHAALDPYISVAWSAGVTDIRRASVLEAQKIAYLLQAAGIGLKLSFVRHHYGPFSPDLNRSLAALEGHRLLGFGDDTGRARAELRLMPRVAEASAVRSG